MKSCWGLGIDDDEIAGKHWCVMENDWCLENVGVLLENKWRVFVLEKVTVGESLLFDGE